jgi:hypothetical protein
MEKPKVSSLLCKRDIDFDNITNTIIKMVEQNLIKAVQFFLNKSRDMKIVSLEAIHSLPGFCMINLLMTPNIGDIISINNEQIVMDETNVNKYLQSVQLIVSLKALDINSPFVLYKNIKDINLIITSSKHDVNEKLLKYNSLPLDEKNTNVNILEHSILENPEFADILDIFTKPEDISIMGFDTNNLNEEQITNLKILESMESIKKSVN